MSLLDETIASVRAPGPALVDERVELSWATLDSAVRRAANALMTAELGPERRFAVFAHNSAETALAYVAGLRAGASSVPVNFHLTADELGYILADSDSRLVLAGPETVAVARAAAAQHDNVRVIAWRCPEQSDVADWSAWLDAADDSEPPATMRPLPHLHYTSGTTGRPKGTLTPPTMFPDVDTVEQLFERLRTNALVGPAGPSVAVGPLYHTGPLGLTRLLAGGIPLVTIARFDAEALLRTIERYRIERSVMVPTHFQRLLALPEAVRKRYDVSSMKLLSHTGAACPIDTKRWMIDWFGPVLTEAYGATEAGTTNLITSEEWLERPGSVGRTQPPYEPVILGKHGEELEANEVGDLYFRDTGGRGIIYHNDPEKTAAAHAHAGVFTLGEIGYVDDAGYVFITDRASDMIVSGGVNIYPAEAEQVLLEHPAVADVAVIGVPNIEMGEEVKALVLLKDPSAPPDVEELHRFCRARLAAYKCPRTYAFPDDIGRNAMGKINKKLLARPYWESDRMIGG